MRVICIDDSPGKQTGFPVKVKIGQEYEVEVRHTGNYCIKEIHPYYIENSVRIVGYQKCRFIPLSEIDERQFKYAEPIKSTFILKEV